MSSSIKYAYLKQQTWLYRRNFPKDLQPILGAALKQSLKTGDSKLAKARAAEVNAKYEDLVQKAESGEDLTDCAANRVIQLVPPRFPQTKGRVALVGRTSVSELASTYLNKRSKELRPGGFKSVRFSIGLLVSLYGTRPIGSLSREDGRLFLKLISDLSPDVGKSIHSRDLGLEQLVKRSAQCQERISVRTQKRIWTQAGHFLDWALYEGHLGETPFKTIRIEGRQRGNSYAVLTDPEVTTLLNCHDPVLGTVLLFCLLTGMRSGEACGLLRDDLVTKGNLGVFAKVRPNAVRALKSAAAEREVPLHDVLVRVLASLPPEGRLFPDLTVSAVTKRFRWLSDKQHLSRPGLVFHSTRKWFITQCERTGVPEHFTASLVGHQSARSENKLTYGIYSAGISDAQKREIIDQVTLPKGVRL